MIGYISPDQQRLVIEKLYYSNDSVTSTHRFNKKYKDKTGTMGQVTMRLTTFGRKMKRTDFSSYDVERFTKSVVGDTSDLESL